MLDSTYKYNDIIVHTKAYFSKVRTYLNQVQLADHHSLLVLQRRLTHQHGPMMVLLLVVARPPGGGVVRGGTI